MFGVVLLVECAAALRFTYFAYGSNINSEVFEGRRGIRPFCAARGLLADHRLAFNLRGGAEAFGSVEPCPGAVVHGILYSLSPGDWLRLCTSEAVPVLYRTRKVTVSVYDSDRGRLASSGGPRGAAVPALTLQTTVGPWRADRADEPVPSRRYVQLLKDGADRVNLDPHWVETLDDILRLSDSREPSPTAPEAW